MNKPNKTKARPKAKSKQKLGWHHRFIGLLIGIILVVGGLLIMLSIVRHVRGY